MLTEAGHQRRTQCKTVIVDALSIRLGLPIFNNLFRRIAAERKRNSGVCCISRRRAVAELARDMPGRDVVFVALTKELTLL